MASAKLRPPAREPTAQQWEFAEARVNGETLVNAFVRAYPARGPRSREGERVKAKRLGKNPTVVWAMQQIAARRAEEDAVANPEQVRTGCLIALRRIRQGRLDTSHTRAVLAELREANREIERREEEDHRLQRAERGALERALRQQFTQDFKAMMAPAHNPKAVTAPDSKAPSACAVPPPIKPPEQPRASPRRPAAPPTPLPEAPPTRPDSELHQYVHDDRTRHPDRKSAGIEKPVDSEPHYLPGHFPPKLAWAAGSAPRLRATTLPTFTAHRTGREVPVLTVFRERWGSDSEATNKRKPKEPREYY
jgi:hypothetical protein